MVRERERKSTKSKSYVLLLPCRISHEQLYVLLFLTLEPGAAKRDPLNAATRKKLHELDIFKVSVLVFGILKGSDNKHFHFTWMGGGIHSKSLNYKIKKLLTLQQMFANCQISDFLLSTFSCQISDFFIS